MPYQNRASWLMAKQSPVNVVDTAPYTAPSEDELVIRTKAIAINPADYLIQQLGILIQDYPAILGCDVAGEVVECHPSLAATFSVGDRVIGSASCLQRKDGVYCYSAFQEYVVLKPPFLAKIPNQVVFEDAVVLPLGINTAASCLFLEETLALQAPSKDGLKPGQGKTLLIWGASSSVGACGVQMAVHAGYEVVGVASKKNHQMVHGLGATICFDQNESNIVDDVVKYLAGKEVVGAYAAISTDMTLNTMCDILSQIDGKKVISSVMPGGEQKATKGVKIVTNFMASETSRKEGGKLIWQWLGQVMKENKIQYMPQSKIVGKGLHEVQQAVDLLAKGVSAQKLVVAL